MALVINKNNGFKILSIINNKYETEYVNINLAWKQIKI